MSWRSRFLIATYVLLLLTVGACGEGEPADSYCGPAGCVGRSSYRYTGTAVDADQGRRRGQRAATTSHRYANSNSAPSAGHCPISDCRARARSCLTRTDCNNPTRAGDGHAATDRNYGADGSDCHTGVDSNRATRLGDRHARADPNRGTGGSDCDPGADSNCTACPGYRHARAHPTPCDPDCHRRTNFDSRA